MPTLTQRPPGTLHADPPTLRDDPRAQIDRVLFARRDNGDLRARDELIKRFLPLARSIARRYEHSGEPLDDLIQVASLALVNAIDRYDPARGYAFSSYAVPTIAGELKRYFRDRTWQVRPPRDLQERALRVETAANELTAQLDRAPTVPELASATGARDEQILEALLARRALGALSLQAPAGPGDDDCMLQDTLATAEHGYAQAEARAELERLLHIVAPRTRLVLYLRYERDLTQAEIGDLLGVSQMQISRIIRSAIDRLGFIATHKQQRLTDRQPATA